MVVMTESNPPQAAEVSTLADRRVSSGFSQKSRSLVVYLLFCYTVSQVKRKEKYVKSYKFRLYPTDAQIERLDWQLARCCEVYNAALQERKDAWNACKKHPNFYDSAWREEHAREYSVHFAEQCRWLTVIRNEIRPEYQQIGSHVLQNVLHRV